MDTTTTMSLSYGNVRGFLRSQMQVSFYDAMQALQSMKLVMQTTLAYREIYPENHAEKLQGFRVPTRLDEAYREDDAEYLPQVLFEAVGDLFPLDENMVEMNMNEIGIPALLIEPQNVSMSWDEFSEMVDNIEDYDYDPETWGFPMFIWGIGNGIDEETWKILRDHFGWGVDRPDWMDRDCYFDMPALSGMLKEAGLSIFENAIYFVWKDAGNLFIDYDPHFEHDMGVSFDAANICRLTKEFQKAIPIIKKYELALAELDANPSIYTALIELMGKCLKDRD